MPPFPHLPSTGYHILKAVQRIADPYTIVLIFPGWRERHNMRPSDSWIRTKWPVSFRPHCVKHQVFSSRKSSSSKSVNVWHQFIVSTYLTVSSLYAGKLTQQTSVVCTSTNEERTSGENDKSWIMNKDWFTTYTRRAERIKSRNTFNIKAIPPSSMKFTALDNELWT